MKHYSLVLAIGIFLSGISGACAQGHRYVEADASVNAVPGKVVDIEVEDGVGDLVRSGDPSTLKVEHTAGHLFVTPLGDPAAELTVIDGRGKSHRIKFIFDHADKADEKVIIGDRHMKEDGRPQDGLAIALMRDLVRGVEPQGAAAKRSDALMLDNAQVCLQNVMVYELPQVTGYVMVIRNKTQHTILVPVQQVVFPGLLAVSSEKDMLQHGEEGKIYMVARR